MLDVLEPLNQAQPGLGYSAWDNGGIVLKDACAYSNTSVKTSP